MSWVRSTRSSYDNGEVHLGSKGFKLSFHEEGPKSASNVLLLLHGRDAHSGTWRKNLPHLAQKLGVHAIAPTLPRLLETRKNPTSKDVEEYSSLLGDLISKADEVSVIGNSMGGWIAMQMALTKSKIQRIVLEDTAGSQSSLPDELSQLGTPVLIIWGEKDPILPVENARLLNSKIKDSLLVTFKEVGHVPHWEVPEEFNLAVERFLSNPKKTPQSSG